MMNQMTETEVSPSISKPLKVKGQKIMTAKRSLVQCYSQLSSDSVNRRQLELIRNLCQEQLGNQKNLNVH